MQTPTEDHLFPTTCFAYPFIFLLTTSASGKIFASFMHHCVSEYYEAKLFHRTPWEFFLAVCTKALTDIVGMEFDHDDLEAGVGGGDVQDEFDLDDVDLDVEKIEEKDESPEKPLSQSLDPDMEEPTYAVAKDKEDEVPVKPMSRSLDPDMEEPTNAAESLPKKKRSKSKKKTKKKKTSTPSKSNDNNGKLPEASSKKKKSKKKKSTRDIQASASADEFELEVVEEDEE